MWIIPLVCLICALPSQGATVTGISTKKSTPNEYTKRGSFAGGTSLYIHADFGTGDPSAYHVKVGENDCPTVHFSSDYSTIECIVPPSEVKFYYPVNITMYSNMEKIFFDYGANISYFYDYERTPWILYMNPNEACPGDEVSFVGRWGTTDMTRVKVMKVDNKTLEIFDDDPGLDYWGWRNVTGVMHGNYHGDTKPVVLLDEGYGNSMPLWVGTNFAHDGTPFDFRALARIDQISHHEGSSAGGLEITIQGAGFPNTPENYEILADGASCSIKSITFDKIICTIGPNASPSANNLYQGGAGLVREYWKSTDSFANLIGTTPLYTYHIANPQIPTREDDYIKSRMFGLFIAPVDGDYFFYLSSDDGTQVFLSTDSSADNAVEIINFSSWTDERDKLRIPETMSSSITLTANTAYYLEIRHTQYTGGSHCELGVEMPGNGPNKLPYIQEILVQPTTLVREIQMIIIGGTNKPTGGNLILKYGTTTLNSVAWDIASASWKCSDVRKALNNMGIGNFICDMTRDDVAFYYSITFDFPRSSSRKILAVDTSTIVPAGTPVSTTKTVGSLGLDGTFIISYGGKDSAPIKIGTWVRQIERDLNVLFLGLDSNLILKGSSNGDKINFFFELPASMSPGSDPLFTIKTDLVTGGALEGALEPNDFATTSTVNFSPIEGRVYFPVIPSDFLRNIETTSQLTVNIAGLRAVCRGDCSFSYKTPPEYPLITGITENANSISFAGTAFDASSEMITVEVGYAFGTIMSISDTAFESTLPVGVAGTWNPIIRSKDKGFVVNQSSTQIILPLEIDSIAPTEGSIMGGTEIVIRGKGFLNDINNKDLTQTVKIGDSPCQVTATSINSITCITSAQGSSNNVLTIVVGTVTQTLSTSFYSVSATPSVTSFTPTSSSTIEKATVTITGTGFSANSSILKVHLTSVDLGDYECMITSSTGTSITCVMYGGPKGTYNFKIYVSPNGFASFNNDNTFKLELEITTMSPLTGSKNGGTLISITGKGFSAEKSFMSAFIESFPFPCLIQDGLTTTSLTCITPAIGDYIAGTEYHFLLYGRLADKAECPNGCTFTWTDADTPVVDSIEPSTGKASDSVILTGSNFGTDDTKVQVTFDGIQGSITSLTETSITVTVPSVQGLTLPIQLFISGKGIGSCDFSFINTLTITDVSPKQISKGGDIITISGSGFDSGMTFTFGSVSCTTLEIFDDHTTCQVGSYTTDENTKSLTITGTRSFTCEDTSICAISFTTAKSFTLSSKSGNLSLTGTFPSGLNTIDVTVSLTAIDIKYSCIVTSVSATTISCTPDAPAGTYTIIVHINGYGFATSTLSYTISLTITNANSPSCSYAGGQVLTLTGTGLHETSIVNVCKNKCEILTSNGLGITCALPPVPTSYSQSTYDIAYKPNKLDYFTVISSSSSNNAKPFDGDITTYYNDGTNADVYLGLDVGSGYTFKLSMMRFIGGGNLQSNFKLTINTKLQGSNDATVWTDLYTFATVNNFWNSWKATGNTDISYRYYRLFKSAAGSNYAINELEFFGILISTETTSDTACPITVQSSSTATVVTASSTAQYSDSLTSYITSITPSRGTTLGGTLLTLSGSGFETTIEDVSVIIDDIPCSINSVTDTEITCTTGPRPVYTLPSLEIFISNKGYSSTKGHVFIYADLWSSTTTWGGEVPPREGESVYIPPGKNIILDIATPILDAILVEGSLSIDDVPNLTLDAHYIFVHGGSFTIGTEDNPFINDITITIHGNRESPALPNYGNKFIAIRNGVLDIHGDPRTPSWTLLETTAIIGATSITLQESVNWKVGEQIVIATTSYLVEETEVRTITEIVGGNVIHFAEPLEYSHYAVTETYTSGTMDMRGEVGLLSRNIKIRGSDEGLDTLHGVHIMLFAPGDESCIGRIENLELFYAGQAYTLGRYPLHFHMIGTVYQSYIKNNAVHDTFNRATTVHGVFYLTIENNVAFNNMGHAYFIEDGIESQNTLRHNLGVNTMRSYALLNFDQTPATFWITNPSNYIVGNRAAGSQSYGFWYFLDDHPSGPSATSTVWPKFMELGQFLDNTAHSCFKYGLRIFRRFFPVINPGEPIMDFKRPDTWNVPNTPITAVFERFTAWKCQRDGAIVEEAGDIRFKDFKIADCKVAGIETTYTNFTELYKTTRIENALIIGNSGNVPNDNADGIGIITSQTDGLLIDGAHFVNFVNGQYPIGDESHSVKCTTRDTGARITKLKGLSYENSHKKFHWEVPFSGIFEVLDDSLTGETGIFVAAFWTHLLTPECTDQMSTYNAIVCSPGPKIRRIAFYDHAPAEIFHIINVTITRLTGDQIPTYQLTHEDNTETTEIGWTSLPMQQGGKLKSPLKAWGVPFVTGYKYQVHWGHTPIDWTKLKMEQTTFDGPEWVHLLFNFTDHRENFIAKRGVLPVDADPKAADFVDPRDLLYKDTEILPTDPSGTYTWDNVSTRAFEIMINGINGNEYQWGDITVDAFRCFGTHCSPVSQTDNTPVAVTIKYWSDPTIWPNGVLPLEGSYVVVPLGWHLYLDMDTPILKQIDINGVLEFSPNASCALNAHWIFVRAGSIVSGSTDKPTKKEYIHSIILHGKSTDFSFAFNPDVQGGNKVLVVTGNMSLHGYPKITRTYLEQNIYPDDDVIFVSGVDWDVGDSIGIAPSGFATTEVERFKIKAIEGVVANYDQIKQGITVDPVDFASDPIWQQRNSIRSKGKSQIYEDTATPVTPGQSLGITKITLDGKIAKYHSGASIVVDGTVIDMRTAVVLLNRNVQIKPEGNGWQFTAIVNDFLDELVNPAPVFRTGFVNLDYVSFSDCSQMDTNLACLRFENVGTMPSIVTNSAFVNSSSWVVYMNGASNIDFSHNTFYDIRWRGFVATNINNINIDDNIIVRLHERGYVASNKDASAGFHVCTSNLPNVATCSYKMTNNVVIGFDFAGFIASTGECENPTKVFSGNAVKSGSYGYILTNNGVFSCAKLTNLVAHFCKEGLGFRISSYEFEISGLELVENIVGMSVRTGRERDFVETNAQVSNSIFVGKTIHSYCTNCVDDLDCPARFGYMFGHSDTKNFETTMMSKIKLPLYKQYAESNVLGAHYISSMHFANYNYENFCRNNSYALVSDNLVPDYPLPQFVKKLKFTNVNEENRVYMNDPNPVWINEEQCVNWNCTGQLNHLIFDLDGTFIGNTNGGYILANNPGIAKKDICVFHKTMNAYFCEKNVDDPNHYVMLQFESLDGDNKTRIFSPMNVSSYGNTFTSVLGSYRNDISNFMDHGWDGFYASHNRWSLFPSVIWSGVYYNISTTGTPPNEYLFSLKVTQDLDSPIIVAMKYQDPTTVQIYVDDVLIEPIKFENGVAAECTLSDPHGTNRWFYEENTIQFVMRNEKPIKVKKTSSVKINMELDMTIDDFFANDGATSFLDRFAAALNIPPWRIRIVNVKKGSVILNIEVVPESGTLVDEIAELASIEEELTNLIEGGSLDDLLDVTIMYINVQVNIVEDVTDDSDDGEDSTGNEDSSDDNSDSGSEESSKDPNGDNQGHNVKKSMQFDVVIEDWVISVFAGGIFLIIVVSGLVLYNKNVNRNVSLKEVLPSKSVSPSESMMENKNAWVVDRESPKKLASGITEEYKSSDFSKPSVSLR